MLEQYINSRKIIRRENKTLVLELLFSSLLPLCALSIIDRFASYKEGTQRSRHSNTKYIFPYFSRYNRFLQFLSHCSNFTSLFIIVYFPIIQLLYREICKNHRGRFKIDCTNVWRYR